MSRSVATACWTPVNPGGSTPTTVADTLLIRTVLPITSVLLPKRARQNRWLIATTGGASGASSSGRIERPSSAWTPRTRW